MLDHLIRLSVRDRLAVVVLTIVITVLGLYLIRDMAVDVLPDVSAPVVTVLTEAPGMPPEEVERLITWPIESGLVGGEGVRRVISRSILGFSSVQVEFDWDIDVHQARQITNEKLQSVADRLPSRAGSPFLAPVTSIMGEIMLAGFTAPAQELMDLRSEIEFVVRRELLSIPGVAAIAVYGGETRQFVVEPDPNLLADLRIGLDQVMTAASEASASISGGYFTHSGREFTIRGFGRAESVQAIGETFLQFDDNGYPIRLADVAEVTSRPAPRIGGASINAEDGIILVISKEPAANTLELTRQIIDRLEELKEGLGSEVALHTDLFQQASFIEIAITNVMKALLISGLLVVAVLILFLVNWRMTWISLVAIPVSVLLSVMILYYAGLTFNTMTLGGIAIAIGVLVDDAIVFVENVWRRLRENSQKPSGSRQNFNTVVMDASMEMKHPIVLANFTIVVVFLPLYFLTGLEGSLLMPLGFAYVTTILSSLLVALVLTPAMSAILMSSPGGQAGKSWFSRKLDDLYLPILMRALRYCKAVLSLLVLLIIATLALIPGIGRSFLPEFNEGTLNIGMATMPGTSLEESNRLGMEVERVLLAHPAVVSTARRYGRAERDEHTMGSHGHEIEVRLLANSYDMNELMEEVRSRLEPIPGINVSLDQPISHRIDHMLTGVRTNLAVKVYGPDRDRLQQLSRTVEQLMYRMEGLEDILTAEQLDVPQLHILPDRELLSLYGLTMGQFSQMIETAHAGSYVDRILLDPYEVDLVVRFPESYRVNPDAVAATPIALPSGGVLRLSDLSEVRIGYSPAVITRENASRMIATQANIVARDQRAVVEELRQLVMSGLDLRGGYTVQFDGLFEQEEQATRTILLTSLLSLILIFIALYHAFRSTGQVLLIMINLPLAMIGGILVVKFTGGVLTIAGLIGFITLYGIAIRNGIILVTQYNELISSRGYGVRRAVVTGSQNRLQPILMTVITTALALLPLVWTGNAPGNEIQGPMAAVILGGLISATLLNMIAVPLLFDWYFQRRS